MNRGAAYMSLRRFRQALDDTQIAMTLQNEDPSSRTLLLLATCHLALGDPTAALRNVQTILDIEGVPENNRVLVTKALAENMQQSLDQSHEARKRKEWLAAKNALDKAVVLCEGDRPLQWRIWEAEIQVAMMNWNEATAAVQ